MNYLTDKIKGRLKEIIDYKISELGIQKKKVSLEKILEQLSLVEPARDFVRALSGDGVKLIAEVKKASPSAGDINADGDIVALAQRYEAAGASAISVLTDKKFFKGELDYLKKIKEAVSVPVLRKDFIFDPYQIYQSKFYGADAILLIATILTAEGLKELVGLTHTLGMKCLVEVHDEEDLTKALNTTAKVIGINARNLETFEVNLQNVIDLALLVPPDRILIAESGIKNRKDVSRLRRVGVGGILVGTELMRAEDVGGKIRELVGE